MQVKITAFLGSLGAVCICMLKDSEINNLTEGKVKVAGEPGADFWQVLVNVDVLFEVPASTADTQLCLLSLAFICSFSSSLPSKLPMDTLEYSSPCRRCWVCSGLGLQQKNVNSSAGQDLLRDGGTREGPQPLALVQVQTSAVLLLPPDLELVPIRVPAPIHPYEEQGVGYSSVGE